MLFISDEFLVFLVVVLSTLALVRGSDARRWLLLAFCVWFYASWSVGFLGLLFANILIDWAIALRLGAEVRRRARLALARLQRRRQLLGRPHDSHALAATALDSLEHHRVPDRRGLG